MTRAPAGLALLAVAAACSVLAGCLISMPAPMPRAAPAAAAPEADRAAPPPVRRGERADIVVAPGDTLWGIARRHEVPLQALIAANGLEPPYTLHPGWGLTLPPSPPPQNGVYVVVAEDTLSRIARRFATSVAALANLNAVEPPYVIRPGQRLRLPGAAPSPAPIVAARPAAAAGAIHREAADAKPPAVRAAATQPAAVVLTAPREAAPATQEARTAAARPAAVPVAVRREARATTRAGRSFRWPVEGPVLSEFGPRQGLGRNDGINIAAPQGAPVRAADDGVVVYAGNELRSYGNLLLIRHDGDWTSAYAHNGELLVDRGAAVARGQVIARVGSSGGVSEPQSHFELRNGAEAVDPLEYLVRQ